MVSKLASAIILLCLAIYIPTTLAEVGGDCSACSGTNEVCTDKRCGCAASHVESGNACVECTENTHCKDNTKPVCDTNTKACVACPANTVYNDAKLECVACNDNGQCSDTAKPKCNTDTNLCEACADNTVYNTVKLKCVACNGDSHCTDTPATPKCNTDSNTCIECTSNTECSANQKVCNVDNTCEACTTPKVYDAAMKDCVIVCTTDEQCTALTATPVCKTGTNKVCVECNVDDDCTTNANGEVCKTDINICVARKQPKTSQQPDPAGKQPTTSQQTVHAGKQPTTSQQTVHVCTTDEQCTALTATPVCNTGTNKVCVECNVDGDCTTNENGEVCNTDTNICGAGKQPATSQQTDPDTGCTELNAEVMKLQNTLTPGFQYTDDVCRGIIAALTAYKTLRIDSTKCPTYKPYEGIDYTFDDLQSVAVDYCKIDGTKALTSPCEEFTDCFKMIKKPSELKYYTEPEYWCAVVSTAMKCGTTNSAKTACETNSIKPDDDRTKKIAEYCPNAPDLTTETYNSYAAKATYGAITIVLTLITTFKVML